MATLSQQIMSLQGLSGTAFQRQKQLWEKMGNKGNYTGSYAQNIALLNQVPKYQQTSQAPQQQAQPIAQPQSPSNPFDSMKQAFSGSDLMKAGVDWESANPFSNFFNADKVKEFLNQKYKPDFDRQNDTINQNDAAWKRDEAYGFDKNFQSNTQNLANNGALFGGVRQAQEADMNTKRNNTLADYQRQLEEQKFNLARQQGRTVDDQLNTEKDLANQQWQDRKKRDVTSKFQAPGYSV